MNILLFDTPGRNKLFPLTLTRAIADIRVGILTMKERWEKMANAKVYVLTEPYLQPLYEEAIPGEYYVVDSSVVSSPDLVKELKGLELSQGIFDSNGFIAGRIVSNLDHSFPHDFVNLIKEKIEVKDVRRLEFPFNIFQWNEEVLIQDFECIAKNGISNNNILDTSNITKASQIFIEEGVKVDFSTLNASTGPIYLGKNSTIMEGCMVRGPFALCEGATLKMGSKIYGATTLGPHCVGGGEMKNVVMLGYSNKAHDGYLGDSVIGEWCNLGAGTSNSNIKNTATQVRVWDQSTKGYIPAGLKCGVIMGDYSRTAINTSINTGTVIGVCCNVFGEGFTQKFIPNFTWSTKGLTRYELDKALSDISNWKNFKSKQLLLPEMEVLRYIFDHFND